MDSSSNLLGAALSSVEMDEDESKVSSSMDHFEAEAIRIDSATKRITDSKNKTALAFAALQADDFDALGQADSGKKFKAGSDMNSEHSDFQVTRYLSGDKKSANSSGFVLKYIDLIAK